jgi:molybdenum-dependent DNA-binding transcriptional regulator ModE
LHAPPQQMLHVTPRFGAAWRAARQLSAAYENAWNALRRAASRRSARLWVVAFDLDSYGL